MNILVTGATKGIGFCIALEFIKRGHRVFGIGRNWENFSKEKFNGMFVPIKCDITDEKEREKIFNWFNEKNIDINILVNNAGMGSLGEFKNISWEENKKIIDLNIVALTHMTKLFIKNLEIKKFCFDEMGIINISSTASFQSGGPCASVYYASKSYVKSFTLSLYEELYKKGVKVICVCPGPVKTDFKGMKNIKKSFYIMKPEKVAEICVKDYFKGKNISVTGFINKFFVFISKFIPQKRELKIIHKIQKNKI